MAFLRDSIPQNPAKGTGFLLSGILEKQRGILQLRRDGHRLQKVGYLDPVRRRGEQEKGPGGDLQTNTALINRNGTAIHHAVGGNLGTGHGLQIKIQGGAAALPFQPVGDIAVQTGSFRQGDALSGRQLQGRSPGLRLRIGPGVERAAPIKYQILPLKMEIPAALPALQSEISLPAGKGLRLQPAPAPSERVQRPVMWLWPMVSAISSWQKLYSW